MYVRFIVHIVVSEHTTQHWPVS